MRKVVKFILRGLLFGLVLYGSVYFMVSRGDAFKYVDQRIRSSAMIESKIGQIKDVRLDPLGGYEGKSVGSDEWVTMKVKVFGANTEMVLDIRVKKTNGAWAIEQVSSQGAPLVLSENGSRSN